MRSLKVLSSPLDDRNIYEYRSAAVHLNGSCFISVIVRIYLFPDHKCFILYQDEKCILREWVYIDKTSAQWYNFEL